MSKIVEIRMCLDCPYQRGVDECVHPRSPKDGTLPDLEAIPKWCHLPDAKEDTVKEAMEGRR